MQEKLIDIFKNYNFYETVLEIDTIKYVFNDCYYLFSKDNTYNVLSLFVKNDFSYNKNESIFYNIDNPSDIDSYLCHFYSKEYIVKGFLIKVIPSNEFTKDSNGNILHKLDIFFDLDKIKDIRNGNLKLIDLLDLD